jgi:hypothetical protein
MRDVMLLAIAIGLLGMWMYGSTVLCQLLWRYILRRTPTGGAAAALAALVYFGTYCLALGVLGWLLRTRKLLDHASIPF